MGPWAEQTKTNFSPLTQYDTEILHGSVSTTETSALTKQSSEREY